MQDQEKILHCVVQTSAFENWYTQYLEGDTWWKDPLRTYSLSEFWSLILLQGNLNCTLEQKCCIITIKTPTRHWQYWVEKAKGYPQRFLIKKFFHLLLIKAILLFLLLCFCFSANGTIPKCLMRFQRLQSAVTKPIHDDGSWALQYSNVWPVHLKGCKVLHSVKAKGKVGCYSDSIFSQ